MQPLERSQKVHQEADFILRELRVMERLDVCGRVTAGGSYFLDTMIYPDIDLYVSAAPIDTIFQIGAQFASHPWVSEVNFAKSDDPDLPNGLYLKPRIHYGDWGRPWKMDIWFLADSLIDAKMEESRRFLSRMTPALRERIIRYKASILTSELRTPMYSGYFIYKAFLEEGLEDFDAVTGYLIEHGIKM